MKFKTDREMGRSERGEIEEFDEALYRKLIKQIIVYKDDSVKVVFQNNNSIKTGYQNL